MTQSRLLFAAFCAVVCLRLAAQTAKPAEDLPLDALLNTRISTAAKYEQRVTDVPASVTVITAEEIARNGWQTLADALASVPGVTLTYDRGYTYLGLRGAGLPGDYNNRFLILLNGQPMLDGVAGAIDTGTALGIDMSSLARIEFVRGPGSVLYGSGAMFGVVNLVLKSEEEASSVTASVGSHHTTKADGRFVLDLNGGFRMSVVGSVQNDHGQNLYYPEFDTPENNNGVSVGHDYDNYRTLLGTVAGHGLRFLALTSTRTKGIPTAYFGTTFNRHEQFTDGRNLLALTADHRVSATGQLFLRTSYDRFDYHGQFQYGDQSATDRSISTRFDTELRYIWDAKPNHRITFGAEHVDNVRSNYTYASEGGENLSIGAPFSIASAYVQSDYQPTHSLSITAGVRFDRYEHVASAMNPRGAIVWHVNASNTVKALYGSAFRLPTEFELEFEDPAVGFLENDKLKPEKIRQIELVWEGRLTPEILLHVSPYRLHLSGLIRQHQSETGATQFLNLEDVISQGVEFQADYRRSDGLWSYASYSRQNAREDGAPLINSPENLVRAGISTPTSRRFQGALELSYESGRKTLGGNETPGVTLTNVTFSTALRTSLRLSATIKNLLNTGYATPGGPNHLEDTIPQNGRTFLVTLRVGS
jgi:outer membrane receptor protein involved in Fe transport